MTLDVNGSGPQTHTRAPWRFSGLMAGRLALRRVWSTRPLSPFQDLSGSDRIWVIENLQAGGTWKMKHACEEPTHASP